MPIITGCCCYADLEKGSRASSYFTLATGIINIFIDIWALVHLHRLENSLEAHEKWVLIPPGLLVLMYLELGCNIGLIVVSLGLLVGINKGFEGKKLVYSWILGTICFRSYEILLGIYVLAWVGSYRVSDLVFVAPEFIVITSYWCLNTLILVAAILCVISYWQETMDYSYGKERRTRYFMMLTNIRQAAKKSRTGTSAYSYYARSAMSGSRMTLTGPGQPLSQSSSHYGGLEHPGRAPIPSVSSATQQPYYIQGMPPKASNA